MTYTIKYTDILAFQKKSSPKEYSKKDHTATINKIFKQISKIRSNQLRDNCIIITFDEKVKFVDPLFFILLFDVCSEFDSTLVIDIRYMDEKPQHYVHRILTQYSDLEMFNTYSPYKNKDVYIPIDIIVKDDTEHREQEYKRFIEKEAISLFTTVAHKKSLISDNTYKHSMLPILKLRNFALKEIDTTEHEDTLEPYDKRIHFYNQLSLDQSPKEYRTNLQNKIEELLQAVGLGDRGLSSSFRDIFFELIDNIRKHTPSQSNAHISFRKDTLSNLYELIVSDNSDRGFLDTYRETLDKELQRLKASGLKREHLENYTDVIKDIKNKNYEKVLKGLFQVQKSTVKDSDEEIHIHQIPRIAMHFGLPLLVKLLEKLSKKNEGDASDKTKSEKATPELKLFLHNDNGLLAKLRELNFTSSPKVLSLRDFEYHRVEFCKKSNQFFEITYSFKNGISTMNVNCNSSHTQRGTHIIVIFPEDVEMLDSHDFKLTGINFKNSDYKLFIDNRDDIQNKINKFTFYLDKHISDDLDRGIKTIHTCENKCTLIKFTGHNTFSEFLRNIYLYAYKHEIEDVVITNVPLFEYQEDGSKKNSENIEHIKLLETIIYGDEEAHYEKSLNVLFYSDRSPEAVIVGGRNQKEYCYLNNLLPNWYGGLVSHTICQKNTQVIGKIISSNLFINIDTEDYILPFELFEVVNKNKRNNSDSDIVTILGDMLEIYLNEVAKKDDDVHIDTGAGYHIDRYMEFKKIFEDSRWVRRLAFRLAMHFPIKNNTLKYYLYGTDKYTNMLISLCYTFLDLETFERFKYKLFNIYEDYDYEALKEKIHAIKKEGKYDIYLISSVQVGGNRSTKLIEKYDIKSIPAIRLNINNYLHKKINPLLTINYGGSIKKITDDSYCEFCRIERKSPLLEFTKNDPFFIKDTFFDSIQAKKIKSYSKDKDITVKWFDSLNFGHVERGNNHFLYYINTVKFFNQNRTNIKECLSTYISQKINYDNKTNEKIVLLTSSHDTNNNFVALVNQEVFENEAIVLSFNKSRGEANLHDLKSYEHFDWDNMRVFFVDDSIASSHTLKYFYQLLRSVPGIMNSKSNIGLDGVIVMIDRISSYDETILCSYLKNTKIKEEQLSAIHAFATFEVKPIKSEVEKCFLCTRRDRYSELIKQSALDLTTFQMARRAYKLKKIEYRDIKSAKEKPLKYRFKVYLKAMATSFIYQNYVDKEDFGEFNTLLKDFSEQMYDDIILDKKDRFGKYEEKALKKIIEFQSEIALLKALSSPRLSYYYNVRKWAISTILIKLKIETNKIESKDFSLIYPLKDDLINSNKDRFDKKDIDFIKVYEGMTNLHLINVYFATLGYFEDSKILDTDYIKLYYKITQNKGIKDKTLLHTYPFAVKFTIADNFEKSNYFEKNLNEVFEGINYRGNERKKKYAHINALKIENTLYWKHFIENKTGVSIDNAFRELGKEENMDTKIENFTNLFKSIFGNLKVHLFVSPYGNITPKNYEIYLDDSEKELVNIFDSFNSIDNYSEPMITSVQKIFYGAVDTTPDNERDIILEKINTENVFQSIDNTWANEYTDDYIVIRLTDANTKLLFSRNEAIKENSPVWFRPIGCIVVEKSNTDYNLHLEVTRAILSLKEYIVDYLEKEFNYGFIQEKIQNVKAKIEAKNEIKAEYMNIISQIYHSSQDFIGINDQINRFLEKPHSVDEYKDYLTEISRYTWGLKLLASLSKLKYEENSEAAADINSLLGKSILNEDKDFVSNIRNFLSVSKVFTDNLSNDTSFTIDIRTDSSCFIPLSEDLVKIIIFEMIINALKRMTTEVKPYIIITTQDDNSIIFTNSYTNKIEAAKHIKKINEINVENTERMGIATIKELLSKINFFLHAEPDDDKTEIKIIIKEKL